MGSYVGTLSSGPSTSLILDLGALTSRVAALLRRKDLTAEIEQWLNFVQRDMVKRIKFPELRVSLETTMIASPATYLYDIPSDFGQSDRIFYKNTTNSNNVWGHNLIPLPRKFYAGDVVDLERLLNVSVPDVGDPRYYWMDGVQLGIYPALASNLTGKLQFTYYKVPPDMTAASHEPIITTQYRHYMILLTLYWGKMLLEQEDVSKVAFWKRQYEVIISELKQRTRTRDVEHETLNLPRTGLEFADRVR